MLAPSWQEGENHQALRHSLQRFASGDGSLRLAYTRATLLCGRESVKRRPTENKQYPLNASYQIVFAYGKKMLYIVEIAH